MLEKSSLKEAHLAKNKSRSISRSFWAVSRQISPRFHVKKRRKFHGKSRYFPIIFSFCQAQKTFFDVFTKISRKNQYFSITYPFSNTLGAGPTISRKNSDNFLLRFHGISVIFSQRSFTIFSRKYQRFSVNYSWSSTRLEPGRQFHGNPCIFRSQTRLEPGRHFCNSHFTRVQKLSRFHGNFNFDHAS